MYNIGPKTFEIGVGGMEMHRLVKLASGTVVKNTATATDDPIGAALVNGIEGEFTSVNFLHYGGTLDMVAAGAIPKGDEVYAADDGKIQALPAGVGTYRKIGVALEAASGDGAIIEVLPYDYHATATV